MNVWKVSRHVKSFQTIRKKIEWSCGKIGLLWQAQTALSHFSILCLRKSHSQAGLEEVAPLVVENVAWKRSLPLLELCQVDHDDDDGNALQLQ